jgi:hypothetical protein
MLAKGADVGFLSREFSKIVQVMGLVLYFTFAQNSSA